MLPLSNCNIKISVVSQCRILVLVHYMNTPVHIFFQQTKLASTGLHSELSPDDAKWTCRLTADARSLKHKHKFETDSDSCNTHPQTVHDWQLMSCLAMTCKALPQPPADAVQKQKKKHLQRDFQETARLEHDENFEDIKLKIVNNSTCLSVMPWAQKLGSCYGGFQTGNTWLTNKSSITNIILRCQLWQPSYCPAGQQ